MDVFGPHLVFCSVFHVTTNQFQTNFGSNHLKFCLSALSPDLLVLISWPPTKMPGPPSKHTLFNPDTLNQVTCSIPALARGSFDYLFNTYPVDLNRGCNQVGECGFAKTDCPCLAKFASKVKSGDAPPDDPQAPNVPWDAVTSWNHYEAVFLLFARIWRAIVSAPESEDCLLYTSPSPRD